jgi:hypothetical protein
MMDNRILGGILIVAALFVGLLLYSLTTQLQLQSEASCDCTSHQESGFCPHEERESLTPILGALLIGGLVALGGYLILFDKSQKEIAKILDKQKQTLDEEERFSILLKGLSSEERNVVQAVKEQDGITQQTLRLRTDLHKSKLSIILDSLEKKDLVRRASKGKTKTVHLKIKV